RTGYWTINGDHRDGVELGGVEAGAAMAGGDDDDAFDLAAKEVACGFGLGVGALVGGGKEDGVGVLFGDGADGVRAGGEERIVEVRDDDADGAGAMAAEGASHEVGLILKLFERAIDACAGLVGDVRGAVRSEEHT